VIPVLVFRRNIDTVCSNFHAKFHLRSHGRKAPGLMPIQLDGETEMESIVIVAISNLLEMAREGFDGQRCCKFEAVVTRRQRELAPIQRQRGGAPVPQLVSPIESMLVTSPRRSSLGWNGFRGSSGWASKALVVPHKPAQISTFQRLGS
jgi:hypothetical protein